MTSSLNTPSSLVLAAMVAYRLHADARTAWT